MREITNFIPALAWPTPFSGPQLGQRRLGRADRSLRQAPRPLSSRWDRSTAQLPPALARRGRATPRLHSSSMASGPPSVGFASHLFLAKVAFCATKATPRLGVARHFVVHWLVLSVPLQTWECRRPDHPNHPLPMKDEESSRMNRQKAVPTRLRTESRGIAGRAQTDCSVRKRPRSGRSRGGA